MRVINFTLNISINQNPIAQGGCFGIYYELISSKRCAEDPNISDISGNQAPGDILNDVVVLQRGFIDCVIYTPSDTNVVYDGSIVYNDNNTLDLLSCSTYIKFYVLRCCLGGWTCETIPQDFDANYNTIVTNSKTFVEDVTHQVNKTLCRRYMLALRNDVTYNYPLTITYKSCGESNATYCPSTIGGTPDPNVLAPTPYTIIVDDTFGTESGTIPSGDLGRVIEICSYEYPMVVDSTNTVINNQVMIVEDINESKEVTTGDCCSKCRTYYIMNNESSPIVYQYQNCEGNFTISTLAPLTCACVLAIQGTVRAGSVGQNIVVTEMGWQGEYSNCLGMCN